MSILVVAAHPDDEVLGCGGSVARHTNDGSEVYIAILGEGITSRYPERESADASLKDALRTDCRAAAGILGAKDLFTYYLPDNRFDSVPLLEVVKLIEQVIQRVEPQIIYTHHGGDLNIDHVIVHRAVLTATRPMNDCPVKDIYAFEVASSTEWAFQQFGYVFKPNVFVDISKSMEQKISAMACYEMETRSFPHPRSLEALKCTARRWGSIVGCEYAEAFELIRMLR